ncbi:hypothetical protein ACFV6E_13690 [Streptomyces sp. NPDC059785]|uniref:hypothetical protein n=1 Tax=Streptomyces sp. NPDC059785 TaxID=3346945 RepID=UPI0036466070
MTDNMTFTANTAADGSTVGIQAETVHNSNVYFVGPEASPEEKYKVGVRFLQNGVPSRARELIGDAIARGYDDAEVRFHWVLAMLSKRALHDLDSEELQQLHQASAHVRSYVAGEWKTALRVTFALLAALSDPDGDTAGVLKRLRELTPRQRDLILHHLDLVLTGGLKDGLWAESRERAMAEQLSADRKNRVWAYFEPEPIGARAEPPRADTGSAAQANFTVRAGLCAVATAFLWVMALTADPAAAVIELLVALGAGFAVAHFGPQWWQHEHRRKNLSPSSQPGRSASAGDGFTNDVRRSFDHYFAHRVPRDLAPDQWLHLTADIRNGLIAEIASLYRESRVSVDRIGWLIRYLAEDARDRYHKGVLFDSRRQEQTPAAVKALVVIAFAVLGFTAMALISTVSGASNTLLGILALIVAFWAGRTAALSWLHVRAGEHRLAEETREYEETLAARQDAYQKWKTYLDATRPSELEMETWLTCDKTMFVDEALRQHQLAWRDIITHTILMTPARPYMRGRVKGGPWRYSRYAFRLFLISGDGVREISAEYDFTDAKRANVQRSNYRFDALSSIHVTERADHGYDLELVLTNGPSREIRVKDAETEQLAPEENAQQIAEINLNAAGFIHTFRLLEGIAADGKGWLDRNNPHNPPTFFATD